MTAVQFLDTLSTLTYQELEQIKGFGPILASNLINFTQSQRFIDLKTKFTNLEKQDIFLQVSKSNTAASGLLSGQTICITGSFEQSRNELKSYLSSFGANTTDSVTKKTSILLVGSEPGSKVDKARDLGIKIYDSLDQLKKDHSL